MLFLLVIVIIAMALVLLMPMPEQPGNAAASMDDFDFPTSNQGRSIPEIYGTMWTFGNLIWYGSLSSIEMKMCS